MVVLTVQKRKEGHAALARKEGLLPAVVYGRKEPSTPVAIPMRDFEKALSQAGESSVIELMGLGETKEVLIHDISYDAVTGRPIHADLYAIEKGQKVEVNVPLMFEGVSPAVKDQGGILVKVMYEFGVRGEPKHLPREIIVDISTLIELQDQIHVRDLHLPSGVEAIADEDEVVAMISVAKEEPVEVVPVDISQIEMSVEKGKKEEEPGETQPEAPAEK